MKHRIFLKNYNNEDTVSHSVLLLKGQVVNYDNCYKDELIVDVGGSTYRAGVDCDFKCLVSLNLGSNVVKLTYCCESVEVVLYFEPRATEYLVIPFYIICKNHDGQFQGPEHEDNSVESACDRISLGVKLIQCLLSEKFHENGLERKTFQLESDLCPDVPDCRVFNSGLDVELARNLSEGDLWYHFGKELLNSVYGNVKYKYLCFVSCTRYRGDKYKGNVVTFDDVVGITEAHAALGGGGLALFGSACLHTWPTVLCDVAKNLLNDTIIDKTKFMDQSTYRGTYGACYSTTLGAVCHELCHTFDLGHTYEGIMGRQFDQIDKEFLLETTNSLLNKARCSNLVLTNIQKSTKMLRSSGQIQGICLKTKRGVFWTRSCLTLLYNHRWFNQFLGDDHVIQFDADSKVLHSTAGLCVVELRDIPTELIVKWWDFGGKPQHSFELPSPCSLNLAQHLVMVAADAAGNVLKQNI